MVDVNDELQLSSAMYKILKNSYSKQMVFNGENFLKQKKIENIKNLLKMENFLYSQKHKK